MKELVNNIINYIDANINEDINVNLLSSVFCYDKFYIMKSFKKEVGISIVTYINFIRILNSLNYYELDESVLKIALCNGFNSLEYYSEIFKSFLGVSPIIYKKYISGLDIDIEDALKLKLSIDRINRYRNFIINYKSGILLEEDKGICLTLYKNDNKKIVA